MVPDIDGENRASSDRSAIRVIESIMLLKSGGQGGEYGNITVGFGSTSSPVSTDISDRFDSELIRSLTGGDIGLSKSDTAEIALTNNCKKE